jgi:diguanylate cyclase (GGDEF)-like protein/PAS domain S-box-containing protein
LSGFIVPAAPTGMASIINTATFQEYIGLPIQLFRATCAFILAYISIALLRTSRLEVESQLIQLSKALEVSGDSVIITDRNGIILYTNPAFEQQTGFTKEEAYGKTPVIIKSGAQQQSFYEDLWVTILNGDTFRSYIINKKKDGELYYEYKAIAPITNNKGQIVSFVSTGKDVTEHMLLEQKYEQLASVDTLTEIANRMKFDEVLKYSVDRAKRYNIELSVILFDIDNFKKVNDTYGHLIGDDVLKKIVQIGKENIRESDLIARWGGEEFMILQTDIPSKEALVLAERLRQAIESHIFKDVGKVTASFGVATFRNDEKTDSFLKRVDDALYSAKTSGKNKVVVV